MKLPQDPEDENSFNPFQHLYLKKSWKVRVENITEPSVRQSKKIYLANNLEETTASSASHPAYVNAILIGVTVLAGVIFLLVAALLLYVIIHAKTSSRSSTADEDDDVFDEDVMIAATAARKKRSLPVIRFDVESDSEGKDMNV